jgi:hypothetical protein
MSHQCIETAERFNADCRCVSLDRERLRAELESEAPGFYGEVVEPRPHLFSDSTVFVSGAHIGRMAHAVAAIERVAALPAYREHVLAYAPAIARHVPRAAGVFLGYDFHLDEAGPQLIEINTNAGGGLLNAVLARAQQACCERTEALLPGLLAGDTPEHLFIEMFRAEWRAERGDEPLRSIAIVDDAPSGQYLYPEFVLFKRLFERHGMVAVICDPLQLERRHGGLWSGELKIDLVYNRLTDFALEEPGHTQLRQAYVDGEVVLTPHPHAHALYADKRNLMALSDDALLASWGVDAETRALLAATIPRTELVVADQAGDFWRRRRQLFFKPAGGFGSKAAYRGDKLTRRVFDDIAAGGYVAQTLVPPSLRQVEREGQRTDLKVDLRNYVYRGAVQLVAARLWQGQTTNFRTPGGGFAPVLLVPCRAATAP